MDMGGIHYVREKKIITQHPFQSLDQTGVGQLIQLAVEKAVAKFFQT